MTQKLGKDGGVGSVWRPCRELEKIGRTERYIRSFITLVKCLKITASTQARSRRKMNARCRKLNAFYRARKKQTSSWWAKKAQARSILSMILLNRSEMGLSSRNSNTKKFLCSIPTGLFHRYRGRRNLRVNFLPYSMRRHGRRISSSYFLTHLRSSQVHEISVPISFRFLTRILYHPNFRSSQ